MFIWQDNFSVKVPLLDAQHKKLLDIGNRLHHLYESYDGSDNYDEIVSTIDELYKYTKYHFIEEERLMQSFGFKDLDNHKIQHQKFIDYLEGLNIDDIDARQHDSLKDLTTFIAGWVFKHISSEDFKYSDLISSQL